MSRATVATDLSSATGLSSPMNLSNPADLSSIHDEAQRLLALIEHNAILASAAVINQVVVTHPLSEAEKLEQMRIEARDKRRNRIAARRKALIAKGLLKPQRRRSSPTA